MSETTTILASLAPVFLVMALGYAAGRVKAFDSHNIGSLNALVMDFALPAALFTVMAQASRDAMIAQAQLALVLLGAMVAAYGATYVVERLWFKSDRRASALTALTASGPNVGSAGLPIVAALFSKSASISVAVAVAVAAIVVTPVSLLLLESANREGTDIPTVLRKALFQPIVVAPVLGLSCSLAGLEPPSLIASTLALVGQGASGTALFLTGLVLSAQPIKLSTNVGWTVAMKNVLQPLFTTFLALAMLDGSQARVAVMLMAVPSGAFGVLFAVRYGVASAQLGTMLIASTLLSTVTLTAAILLSSGWI